MPNDISSVPKKKTHCTTLHDPTLIPIHPIGKVNTLLVKGQMNLLCGKVNILFPVFQTISYLSKSKSYISVSKAINLEVVTRKFNCNILYT